MSFFAKECLSRRPFQTSQALKELFSFSRTSPINARHLSNSPILRAAKKPQASKVTINRSKPIPATNKISNAQPSYKTFAEQLAGKTHPTLLYQAPSHMLFKVASYAGGLFCISYSTYNFWAHFLYPPEGINHYVVYAYGGIVVLMTALGTYLILGPARLVSTITALPRAVSATQPLLLNKRVPSAVVGAVPKSELQLEIELRKMLPVPFFPARKIIARPDEIELAQPLAKPLPAGLTPEARRRIAEQEKKALQALQEYEDTHVMSRPFRHAGRGAKTLYNTIARTWLRDGFVKMKVKGQGYKLDVSGGWALDSGRALDRLATVKPRIGA